MPQRVAASCAALATVAGLALFGAQPAFAMKMWWWCDDGNRYIMTDNGNGTFGTGVVYNSSMCD